MPDKPIQEQFGEAMIRSLIDFAKADLEDVNTLEAQRFDHVGDAILRRSLAEIFYGSRWIYKLGLALLVRDDEQLAHVRMQILDYGSICEGLLSDMIYHGLDRGILHGRKHTIFNLVNNKGTIDWTRVTDKKRKLKNQSFFWDIKVAEEEGIIDPSLTQQIDNLRKARNTVHARERTYKSFLGRSRYFYKVVNDTITQTKRWKLANP